WAGIWLAFLRSGVYPTVTGVLLGLFTPSRLLGKGGVTGKLVLVRPGPSLESGAAKPRRAADGATRRRGMPSVRPLGRAGLCDMAMRGRSGGRVGMATLAGLLATPPWAFAGD